MYQWVDENGRTHFSDKPPAAILEKEAAHQSSAKKSSSNISSPSRNSNRAASPSANVSRSTSDNETLVVFKIRNLLQQKKYSELNRILESARVSALKDLSTEESLLHLYQSFGLAKKEYVQLLNGWVNAYPASYQPFLARALYFQKMGWKVRGGKWGSETSDNQKKSLKSYLAKANADIKKALNRNPSSLIAYVLLIQNSYGQSGFKEVDKDFKQGLKLSPASYILRRGYIYRQRPRWGGSLERMLAVIKKSESYIDENNKLINLASWLLEDVASLQAGRNAYTAAKATLDNGLMEIKRAASQNGYLDINPDSYILYKQGKVHKALENYDQALGYFDLAIKGDANVGDYYFERAKTYNNMKEHVKSAKDLKIALEIQPQDESYISFKERLIARLSYRSYEEKEALKYVESLRYVNLALELDPASINALRRRSYVYLAKRQVRLAKQDMDKAIELDLADYESYKGMDNVLLLERRFAEIAEYWKQYIAIKPSDSRAYFERAGTYYHMKRMDLAVKDAQKAVDLGHPNAKEGLLRYKAELIRGR
jgi:tetratricopeptide (TPR) repeat protein